MKEEIKTEINRHQGALREGIKGGEMDMQKLMPVIQTELGRVIESPPALV